MYWEDDPTPTKTMEVNTEGFVAPPGFIRLKETDMKGPMNPENVRKYQKAVALQEAQPYFLEEIDKMINTCQLAVYTKIRKGELTPEDAMAYWMEMYSYARLNTRIKEAVAPANDVTETRRMTSGEA